MKLIVPSNVSGSVCGADGVEYRVTINGEVDIPDAAVHSGLWAQGFTVAPEPAPVAAVPFAQVAEIEKQVDDHGDES